jgi:hypothetical protein
MSQNKFAEIDQLENGTNSDKVIEIRSVYKQGKHVVQPAWDAKANWWAGVDRLSEEDKKSKKEYVVVGETGENARNNSKLTLESGLTFDLNNSFDRMNWAWVKRLPIISASFDGAQSSKAIFYVHVEGREAEVSNRRSDALFNAMRYIMEDPTTNYANRALLLGHDMEGQPTSVIKQFLMDIARKSPIKILDCYRSKSIKMDLLYVSARRLGIITDDPHSGNIMYGRQTIGTTEKGAIAFLRENTDLLDLLEREVKPEYFSKKASLRDSLEVVNDAVMAEPTYPFLKNRAKELGYDGSQKKGDVIAFLKAEGEDLEALGAKEKALELEA